MLKTTPMHLYRIYLRSIEAFTALSESRTAQVGHARKVAQLSRRLARAMALDAEVTHDLTIAALLHDLGHASLNDPVLAHPVKRLGSEELRRYRMHSVFGERAVLAGDAKRIAPMIRSHHERWDGRGFPDGLLGEAIPIGARVIAVADAYDDHRAGRIDGKSLSPLEARAAVIEGRGNRLDPAVVDAFANLFLVAPPQAGGLLARLRTVDLRAGHTLAEDLLSPEGVMLLSAGRRLDEDMVERIREFDRKHGLALKVAVQVEQRGHDAPCSPTGATE